MRYKRMVLLVVARCHDVSTGRHPPPCGAWIQFWVNALCYLCEGGTTERSASRQSTGRMMGIIVPIIFIPVNLIGICSVCDVYKYLLEIDI